MREKRKTNNNVLVASSICTEALDPREAPNGKRTKNGRRKTLNDPSRPLLSSSS